MNQKNVKSKTSLLLAASLLILTSTWLNVGILGASAQVSSWSRVYETPVSLDQLTCLVQTSDGGFAAAGTTLFSDSDRAWHIQMIKTESTGTLEWKTTYIESPYNNKACIVQTTDGGYALLGGGTWLGKTDANGVLRWNKTYSLAITPNRYELGTAFAQTNDGGYILASQYLDDSEGNSTAILRKTDSNGNLQWERTFRVVERENWLGSVAQTSEGGYAAGGYAGPFNNHTFGMWLVKVDASGVLSWSKVYGGLGDARANAMALTSDGGYALAGYIDTTGYSGDFCLAKADSAGNLEWSQSFGGEGADVGGPGNDVAYAVVQAEAGGFAVAGTTNSFGSGSEDMWLIKTDNLGRMEWNQTFGGKYMEFAHSLIQTEDGEFALAGFTTSNNVGNSDFFFVKTEGANSASLSPLSTPAQSSSNLLSTIETSPFISSPTPASTTQPVQNNPTSSAMEQAKMPSVVGQPSAEEFAIIAAIAVAAALVAVSAFAVVRRLKTDKAKTS